MNCPQGLFFKGINKSMRLIQYIKDVKGELRHVSWPTKRQTVYFTALVVVISIATAYYLGFFDFVFARLLDIFVI